MSQAPHTPMRAPTSYAQAASTPPNTSRPLPHAFRQTGPGAPARPQQRQTASPRSPLGPATAQTGSAPMRRSNQPHDDDLPEFSTLHMDDGTSSSFSRASASSHIRAGSSSGVQYNSPQTPPSASSYILRTPHASDARSPGVYSSAGSMHGRQPYGGAFSNDASPTQKYLAPAVPVSEPLGRQVIGRFLLISNLPETVTEEGICDMLQSIATIKALIATFMATHNYVIAVFYDPREATKVYEHLRVRPVILAPGIEGCALHCLPISKGDVKEAINGYPEAERIFESSDSKVLIEVIQGRAVSKPAIKECLEQLSDVMTLETVGQPGYAYRAEFYDTRVAQQAILHLNGLAAMGGRIKVTYDLSPRQTTLGSLAYQGGSLTPDHLATGVQRTSSANDEENHDVFGPIARPEPGPTFPSPPSARSAVFRKHYSQPLTPSSSRVADQYAVGQSLPTTPLHIAAMSRRLSEPGVIADLASRADISARARLGQGLGGIPRSPSQAIPEQNRVFPERVYDGLDKRTSVMIKDVPNKLSRKGLVDILTEVVPGEFDFVYLRFDFNNSCNVGYAFVNFTSVDALYRFIVAKVGKKWNMFSSEKVLQVSYANIQGKQNLINKFRNSAVMSVAEHWRPQIFYSSGAKKGLPEPFPMVSYPRGSGIVAPQLTVQADNANIARRSHEARFGQMTSDDSEQYQDQGVYRYEDEYDNANFGVNANYY